MSTSKDITAAAEPSEGGDANVDSPGDVMLESLRNLYGSSKFSDFRIKINGGELKVHKLVLVAHSGYFSRLFDGNQKGSLSSFVDFTRYNPDAVKAMVRFLYGFKYDHHDDPSPMILNARVYALAGKYEIPAVKRYAMAQFSEAVELCGDLHELCTLVRHVLVEIPEALKDLQSILVEKLADPMKPQLFLRILATPSGNPGQTLLSQMTNFQKHTCCDCTAVWLTEPSDERCFCPHCGIQQPFV